jgi:hypothetical protein
MLGRAQSFLDLRFWTGTAIPAAGGFLGTKMLGGMLYGTLSNVLPIPAGIADKVVRIASDVLAASGLAWAVGRFINPRMASNVFLGGVVGIAHSVLRELLGGTTIGNAIGLSGLGTDLEDRMREAVAARVNAEMSGYDGGMGHYLSLEDLSGRTATPSGVGEFVTDAGLRNSYGYAPTPGANLRDYDPAAEGMMI